MKTDELKMRLHKFVNSTIDLYIPPTNFLDKIKNSTAKLWIDQNIWRIDVLLDSFGDQNHEIDSSKILHYYENALFENDELRLDIKDMIPSEFGWMRDQLPDKIILFRKDDLRRIFE